MPTTTSSSAPSTPWWSWVNRTGLDAVLAALVWLPLFAGVCRAHLLKAEFVVLGCAVWIVYAADRLLDGMTRTGPKEDRHRFAAKNRLWFIAGIVAAGGVSAWLLGFYVREIVSIWGLKLLAVVTGYFILTWVSRQAWSGMVGAAALAGLQAIGLMQGTIADEAWPHAWRGAMAGFLLTVVILTIRNPGLPVPWTLPRKLLGGWLFALGTALVPFAHLEMAAVLLLGNQVLLFGVICGLNSLGIRLWEHENPDTEHVLLGRLYPGMLLVAAAGGVTEWMVADRGSRPLFAACALAAALLLALHFLRGRLPKSLRPLLADAAVIGAGALMLLVPLR